jgi:hypothetical protein
LVQLLDGLGRSVRTESIAAGQQEMELPTVGLAPGFYLLRCGVSTSKLVLE